MKDEHYTRRMLVENWRREMEAEQLYRLAANLEDEGTRRKEIYTKLAEIEGKHAQLWEEKLIDLGFDVPSKPPKLDKTNLNAHQVLLQIESVEQKNTDWYHSLRNMVTDSDTLALIDRINQDEENHADLDRMLEESSNKRVKGARKRLTSLWGKERWHRRQTSGWVGDAVYGVNDGLGAIFGIIAGVAGYTANSQTILISGFFGALASTLSMGAGAWLATKSENELIETEIEQERQEIEEDPEHELEELTLLYELKGFPPDESKKIANRISSDKDQFLNVMSQEELGIHETTSGNPWTSAVFGGVSTLVGGIIPLIPFFFISGWTAMMIAVIFSLLAHFAVGAAKSIMTVRSWFTSGLEMTVVGIIVGVASYGLGSLGALLFGAKAIGG